MNYLAHLFLSEPTPESLVGNLLGDFVKGPVKHLYTEEIRKGIDLHRKVDIYTDSHDVVRSSKSLIDPDRSRFAGIIIDIFYDHFLAKNWREYSNVPLSEFTNYVYRVLEANREILPDSLQRILPHLILEDWLTSYREVSGIDRTLKRMSARIKRENNVGEAIEDLEANYQQFESNFRTFFPDLIDYTKSTIVGAGETARSY
jgi:acyl carrier protein phosphodiesterase